MIKNKLISAFIISTLLLFASCTKDVDTDKVVTNPPPKNNEQVQNPPSNNTPPTPNPQENKNPNPTPSENSGGDKKPEETPKTPESTKPLDDSIDTKASKYSNADKGWYFTPNKTHTTPQLPANIIAMLKDHAGYYVGDTKSKVIYLTFDEGYENGYSSKILDILKANDVQAAFFVTRPYINQNKDLIKRMVAEGHIVANHTSTHPSMPSKATDYAAFQKEFTDTEKAFTSVTGQEMPKFFRPPMGKYSERSLFLTKELGYKSIFWSFAHRDWLVDDQPSVQATHDKVLGGAHNGAIYLLHAVSKSNTEALDSIIKDLKAEGYRFAPLTELK